MNLPTSVKFALWDIDPKSLNLTKHKSFLITRLTEKGTWPAILWLKKRYTLRDIKRIVSASKNVSAKTKAFWKIM